MARPKKEIEGIEVTEESLKISKWANGLRIVCNILKVFTIIGILCMALVLVFTPMMMNKIKIDDKKIVLFDQKIEYSFKDVDFLTYKIDDGEEHVVNTKDIYKYTGLLDVGKTNTKKLRNLVMIGLSFAIVMGILEFIILNLLSKLLLRTRDEKKAFVEGGNRVIVNIMWITLTIEVIKIVLSLCVSVYLASEAFDSTVNIDLMVIVVLCAMYFVSLLYKRGEELENK